MSCTTLVHLSNQSIYGQPSQEIHQTMSNTLGRYAPGSHGSASTAIVFQHPTRQPTLYRSVPKASGSPQSLQKLPQLHAAKVFQHHGMFSQRLSENSQRSARVKLDANLHLLAIHLVARRASARYDRCLYPAQPLRGVTREQQYRRIFAVPVRCR